ncbi:MAG: EVE domain-containing protein [Planctomycetota bacterium]
MSKQKPKSKSKPGSSAAEPQFWLMKTEPGTFSIDDLQRKRREPWDGVRNPMASRYMREEMRVGDAVLFYHSNSEPSGVAGLARVASESYADDTAFNPQSKYFDPRSKAESPRWMLVDVEFVEKFPAVLSLHTIKATPALDQMVLVRNSRLSVQPVRPDEYELVVRMARALDADANVKKSKSKKKAAAKPPTKKAAAKKQPAATKPVAKKKKKQSR